MGEPEENEPPIVLTSQMCKDDCTIVIWHLKGWNEHADFLKDNAGCVVEVPIVGAAAITEEVTEEQVETEEQKENDSSESPPAPPVKIRFYFGAFERQNESKWKRWFSLCVSLLSEHKQVSFLVEAVEVDDKEDEEAEGEEEDGSGGDEEDEDDEDEDIGVKAQITMPSNSEKGEDGEIRTVVKEEFIPMVWWKLDENGKKSGDEHLTEWAELEELKFKITVTLYHYSGSDTDIEEDKSGNDVEKDEEEEVEQIPVIRDLKAMYSREENYADLTLETRDGMILNTHKFVLAARSAYFRGIIEKEVKKKGFTGLIKLANVDGKPMMVVLHWMYTDEILEEQLGKVMDEVIKVSVKWELKDLLKLLDKKLISVCNTKNMLHLFQVAHKNGLYTAIADISEYIKQNIDSVLPTRRIES